MHAFALNCSEDFCDELKLKFVERVIYLATEASDAGTVRGAPEHDFFFPQSAFERFANTDSISKHPI